MSEGTTKCGAKCEVFSRVVGYHRAVQQWNKGKQEEFKDRKSFCQETSEKSKFATIGKPTAVVTKLNSY